MSNAVCAVRAALMAGAAGAGAGAAPDAWNEHGPHSPAHDDARLLHLIQRQRSV